MADERENQVKKELLDAVKALEEARNEAEKEKMEACAVLINHNLEKDGYLDRLKACPKN